MDRACKTLCDNCAKVGGLCRYVFQDRGFFSEIVYGEAFENDPSSILDMSTLVGQELFDARGCRDYYGVYDMILYLKCSEATSKARIAKRNGPADKKDDATENQNAAFHARVRKGFETHTHEFRDAMKDGFVEIDVDDKTEQEVLAEAIKHIDAFRATLKSPISSNDCNDCKQALQHKVIHATLHPKGIVSQLMSIDKIHDILAKVTGVYFEKLDLCAQFIPGLKAWSHDLRRVDEGKESTLFMKTDNDTTSLAIDYKVDVRNYLQWTLYRYYENIHHIRYVKECLSSGAYVKLMEHAATSVSCKDTKDLRVSEDVKKLIQEYRNLCHETDLIKKACYALFKAFWIAEAETLKEDAAYTKLSKPQQHASVQTKYVAYMRANVKQLDPIDASVLKLEENLHNWKHDFEQTTSAIATLLRAD
jgi:hypothetical protein